MFKKSLATAALVGMVPAMANAAWLLSTQARSVGGTITSANGTQTVANGVKSKSFAASNLAAQTITAAANAGYTLKTLTVTDFHTDPVTGKSTSVATVVASPYTLTPVDKHNYSVAAVFAVNNVVLTATNPGGTVAPAKISFAYNTPLAKDLVFVFTPASGFAITGFTGLPAGATTSAVGAKNQAVTVTVPKGTKMTAAAAIAAQVSNANVGLDAILPQTVLAGATVKISATVSNVASPSYTWTYLSGPANVQTSNGANMTFTPGPTLSLTGASASQLQFAAPAVAGQYQFKVVESVSGTTQYATVKVSATAADNAQSCQSCHTGNNVASVADTSSHALCQSCHFGGAGHPGSVNAASVSATTFVVNFDNVANGNGTAAPKGTVFCASCHSAGNAATAMPTLTTHENKNCSSCHTSTHQTQVASTACQTCHATINDHTAANVGTKVCLDCHDGHNPTVATKPFLVAAGTHPPVTLYTFEEIGMQMAGGQKVPVQVDANGKGMPYSPKQTCGSTAGCHVYNGADYSYDKISDTAFHSHEGRAEMMDLNNGNLLPGLHIPWVQSTAMVGKW